MNPTKTKEWREKIGYLSNMSHIFKLPTNNSDNKMKYYKNGGKL